MVDGFCKEIIVDVETQFVIRLVVDLILTERHIADCQIIEILAVGGFKSGNSNVCLWVQFFRNTPGDAVQFHTVQSAICHGVRQHPEKVADAHGRLQDVAGLKAHLFDCLIN